MDFKVVVFSGHSVRRMFERYITKANVLETIKKGEIIAEYPNDNPFPSYLVLGFVNNHPLHVVIASDNENSICHVVTAYNPDAALWEKDFRKKM